MSLRNTLIKKLIAFLMSGWAEGTITEQRARQEKLSKYTRLPVEIQYHPVDADGVPAEWIERTESNLGVILYLHGGAYALGSITGHREWTARLAQATRMRCLALNYRLAPEHPFPAALEDAIASYHWLLAQGVEPSDIIIAGDSAGGGLALSTLVKLRDAGEQLPAGAVCLSPWTDLVLTGASIHSKAKADFILNRDSLQKYAGYYAAQHHVANPWISPLYADLTGFPPLLIQAGSDEILLNDATRLAEKARAVGVDVHLEIWDEMFHVFQLFSFLPETKQAVSQIAAFVSQHYRNT